MGYDGRKPIDFTEKDIQVMLDLYDLGFSVPYIQKELETKSSLTPIYKFIQSVRPQRAKFHGSRKITCEACLQEVVVSGSRKFCETCVPDKIWLQRYRLYGITKPEFEEAWEKQSGLCDMCECVLPLDFSKIHVDHCHKTGYVRGLLCNTCNVALGYIENDKILANAIRYIERHKR